MKKTNNITDQKLLHILIGDELKNKLVKLADNRALSLNSYIRMVLKEIADKEIADLEDDKNER